MCGETENYYEDCQNSRVYLPSAGPDGLSQEEELKRYVEIEFPEAPCGGSVVYSVPQSFTERVEQQASKAEHCVFEKLRCLTQATHLKGLWMLFFHGACYAGHSYRNQRVGKLMIREHDFVVFIKYKGKHHVCLLEVKSTHDSSTITSNTPIISDARVVKNNKRSAQHQLRDHLEVLQYVMNNKSDCCKRIQTYIMWPFLGPLTKDPRGQLMKRWKEDGQIHVFEDTLRGQKQFEEWFEKTVLRGDEMKKEEFVHLMNRYITLSCGVFVDEIYHGMLALLTQEQLKLLKASSSGPGKWGEKDNGPLVVHGAAGTGKTLLVLKKLQLLYEQGELNENKRALYICYWPGIRCDFENKLKILGIDKYVDSARFYISLTGFLLRNKSKYKHIFMDEAEAICLAFEDTIMMKTMSTIYQRYHDGNCNIPNCSSMSKTFKNLEQCTQIFFDHQIDNNWGQLWFLVDINQASLFLPKHSPAFLKIPKIVLNRVMRSTGYIFDTFKQFYSNPMPFIPRPILDKLNLKNIIMGHRISGPPILWVDTNFQNIQNHEHCNQTLHTLVCVIIDLCATKGIKPNNICVIPFLVNDKLTPNSLNAEISLHFVENGYKPQATGDVEHFITKSALNDFLIAWALRVKGLEFKVVILVLEDDDFNINDAEDRKKMYIMASRCTCLLIVICPQDTKRSIDLNHVIKDYSFGLEF